MDSTIFSLNFQLLHCSYDGARPQNIFLMRDFKLSWLQRRTGRNRGGGAIETQVKDSKLKGGGCRTARTSGGGASVQV